MSLNVATVSQPPKVQPDATSSCEELVGRVASSATFEKSPRLRAFLLHVCRCALENKPEEATEQQIGIYVYGRSPGYNHNDDNIVRSQARVLRMKLEHHFVNEGRDERIVIAIPKGQYLPIFETRSAALRPTVDSSSKRRMPLLRWALIGAALLCTMGVIWLGAVLLRANSEHGPAPGGQPVAPEIAEEPQHNPPAGTPRIELASGTSEVRIAAGHSGPPYTDIWGNRWEADRYYEGGTVKPGPLHFFPPVPDQGLFKTIREAASSDLMVPQWQRGFQYDIPVSPGVYELRLYFADPIRWPVADQKEDAQNLRHLQVDLNGHPLLVDLDPVADSGSAAVDVRVFKDVRPADDGKVHLEFRSRWGLPAFVSAIELTPGIPGKLKPIRISTHQSDFADHDGTRWSGDNYFIGGRTWAQPRPPNGPKIPDLYAIERHGNFSYAIPVAPGSYTVRLHFLESFFSPLITAAYCHGAGCRIFDVTCNGVMLLQDFDVYRAAGGEFRPLVREFHDLHPNGQGKLLISFSPKVNYGEIRAIEVIDEAK